MTRRGTGTLPLRISRPAWIATTGEPSADAGSPVVRVHLDGRSVCAGVLLSGRHVLTARHCISLKTAEPVRPSRVRVLRVAGSRALRVHRIDRASGGGAAGDLAILHLATAVETAPAVLSGVSIGVGASAELRRVSLEGSTPAARAPVSVRVRARDGGVLYTSPAGCDGDSGSPLFTLQRELIAVASARAWGTCGDGPSLFTEIGPHRGWIDRVLAGET